MASARLQVVAFGWHDLNPLTWLGSQAAKLAADAWTAAMTGLWSAALWLLEFVFHLIDAFTTPDLTAAGPLGGVLPTTLWLAAFVAGITFFLQIGAALVRRDGQSLGRVLVGTAQFGLVWAGYLTVAAATVVAAGGLTRGILHSLLGVDSFARFGVDTSWPRSIDDAVVATVLGVLALLLVIPAAFMHLVIMLVRASALILLAATSPISAAGLFAEASKSWFWKTLRWFISCVLILPLTALVLGIGTKLTAGVVSGIGDRTVADVGMAVVGAVLVAVSSVCPLVLFRLLAFIEPGTASGAALRQSWSDAGGMAGVLGGSRGAAAGPGGASAATESAGDGRSAGESAAESQSGSRVMAALGVAGAGMATAVRLAGKAADVGSDVLGQGGVGHPGYAMGFADEALMRRRSGTGSGGGPSPDGGGPAPDGAGGGGAPMPDPVPTLAAPGVGGQAGSGPMAPVPTGAGGPAAGGGAGGAGVGAGEGAAVAAAAAAL